MAYIDSRYIHRMTINTKGKHEVKVWCELFSCDRNSLIDAIALVGNNAGKVKEVIKNLKHA